MRFWKTARKLAAAALSVCCAVSSFVLVPFAENAKMQYDTYENPDWLITEICSDTYGDLTDDLRNTNPYYSGSGDLYEFIEIYNNSGRRLNVYDYCVTYNGNASTKSSFENEIVEITRFLPGADWFEGWNPYYFWTGETKCPVNPSYEDGYVEPGDCFIAWSFYIDCHVNNATVEQFRAFWQVPDDVKVICFDANGSSSTTKLKTVNGTLASPKGHDKNFNVKNSGVGTYGIALYGKHLSGANDKVTLSQSYLRTDDIINWAVMDYGNVQTADNGFESGNNYTSHYKYSVTPTVESYGNSNGKRSEFAYFTPYREASVGWLNDEQILSLPQYRVYMKAGEKEYLPARDGLLYYYADNGKNTYVTLAGERFVAPEEGVYTFYDVSDYGFETVTGASVTLDTAGKLKFAMRMSDKMLNDLADMSGVSKVSAGILVARTKDVPQNLDFTHKTLEVAGVEILCKDSEKEISECESLVFGYITDLKPDEYLTSYTARGYVLLQFEDGDSTYIYTDFDMDNNSRSAYTVALAEYTASGSEDARRYLDGYAVLLAENGKVRVPTSDELLGNTVCSRPEKYEASYSVANDSEGNIVITLPQDVGVDYIAVNGEILVRRTEAGFEFDATRVVSVNESEGTVVIQPGESFGD